MSSSSNMSPPPPPPTKKGMGRRKIEMKKIERVTNRRVAFTKRRTTLFSKAKQLSIECGCQVAVIVFSQAGKTYSYGSPSVGAVVNRFRNQPDMHSTIESEDVGIIKQQPKDQQKPWWDFCIDDLGLEELEIRKKALEKFQDEIRRKVDGQWLSL